MSVIKMSLAIKMVPGINPGTNLLLLCLFLLLLVTFSLLSDLFDAGRLQRFITRSLTIRTVKVAFIERHVDTSYFRSRSSSSAARCDLTILSIT